jgi:hypothetical protein
MNALYDHHYAVLGLSSEATLKEVRSAYRRLVRIYHPDRDKSADAQVKYLEVRAAYDALRGRPAVKVAHRVTRNTRPQQPPFSRRDAPEAEPRRWESPPSHTKSKKRPTGKKRPPFSWAALPRVVWKSAEEVAGVQILARSTFTCYILWSVIAPVTKTLAFFVIPLSLCGAAAFRHYYTRPPQDKGVYVLASLCYGVGVSAVFTTWTFFLEPTRNYLLTKFVYYSLVFYTAILLLWVHPLLRFKE